MLQIPTLGIAPPITTAVQAPKTMAAALAVTAIPRRLPKLSMLRNYVALATGACPATKSWYNWSTMVALILRLTPSYFHILDQAIIGLPRRMPLIVTTLGASISAMAVRAATLRIIVTMFALFVQVSDWRIGLCVAPAWLAHHFKCYSIP